MRKQPRQGSALLEFAFAATIPAPLFTWASNVQVQPNMYGAAPESITVQITGYTIDAVFTSFTFNGKPSTTFPFTATAAP